MCYVILCKMSGDYVNYKPENVISYFWNLHGNYIYMFWESKWFAVMLEDGIISFFHLQLNHWVTGKW